MNVDNLKEDLPGSSRDSDTAAEQNERKPLGLWSELGISESLKEEKEWRGGVGGKWGQIMESKLKPRKVNDKPHASFFMYDDVSNPSSGDGDG